MNFIKAQIKRFFETGKWAMKLIFLVVIVELGLVVGVVATMGDDLDGDDGKHIHHLLLSLIHISEPTRQRQSRMPSSA